MRGFSVFDFPKSDKKGEAELTVEFKGFLVLKGKTSNLEFHKLIFLKGLEERMRKKVKNFRRFGIKLKSLNITFD